MERCNKSAWRSYPNGYRVCRDHAQVNNPDETLHENSIGPCDYPVDGLGAMRYDERMRIAATRLLNQRRETMIVRDLRKAIGAADWAWCENRRKARERGYYGRDYNGDYRERAKWEMLHDAKDSVLASLCIVSTGVL